MHFSLCNIDYSKSMVLSECITLSLYSPYFLSVTYIQVGNESTIQDGLESV